METLSAFVNQTNDLLWNTLLIFLLCGVGIYYTLTLGFVQIRYFRNGWRCLFGNIALFGKRADQKGMSSFQAVTTAIAGQVGTGNLAGPATAILAGGPGAIFWMWVSSFLGMATIYAEAILGQKFRTTDKQGHIVGGPAYYIENGLHCKWLAVIFAVLVILALGFIGNMVQSNSIASAFHGSLHIPLWVCGIILAALTGIVIIGGIGSIAAFTEKIVPVKATFYLAGTIFILIYNYPYIIPAFKVIFVAAFNPQAVLGGGVGIAIQEAMRFGIARGLFSNEAGMGSTPHAHALAKVKRQEEQGFIAMMGVFVVAIIVTLTALAIITSGLSMWAQSGHQGASFMSVYQGLHGIELTQLAYSYVYGWFGSIFISFALLFFAFSTIIGWYYYGEINIRYLFNSKKAIRIYQCTVVIFIFCASLFKVDIVWSMADMFNGFMVLPNLIALVVLSPLVIRLTRAIKHQPPLSDDAT